MTRDPDALEVAQIDQQIAALEHRKAQLRARAQLAWPKPFGFTLHASRETMHAIGLELGYTGEALTVFAFFGYEVEARGLAEANGQARLVEVAGMRLVPREESCVSHAATKAPGRPKKARTASRHSDALP